MTLVAPRIGNDVSYVPQIAGDIVILRGRGSIW